MTETGLTKNQILSELSKSPHGKLGEYVAIGKKATVQEPEFMARLIAWDHKNGQIRDAKVALPVVSLSVSGFPDELAENSLAHIATLGPREFMRAFDFAKEIKVPGRMRQMRRLLRQYLKDKESDWSNWRRIAVQHRDTLKRLYARDHVEPGSQADNILFKGMRPKGSVFEAIANLKNMSPTEAAGTILKFKIPFLVAAGALGVKSKEPDLVLAMIKQMSPTELVTNTKMLEKLGIKTNPALRGAYEEALGRAATSKKNLLKTTRAAEAVTDEVLKNKLQGLQERQIKSMTGVDGNWLVLGDMSGSMAHAIELAKLVSATLAKMVKGKVWLVFFNTSPRAIEVTGKTYEQIKDATKYVMSNGGTAIGSGLMWALDSKIDVDGIAIVSDGGDNNTPYFHDAYPKYCKWLDKEVPVYLYQCNGDRPAIIDYARNAKIDLQVFDLCGKTDYYALPDLIQTMRTNRYSLVDEIMQTPLLTLKDVFKSEGKEVLTSA